MTPELLLSAGTLVLAGGVAWGISQRALQALKDENEALRARINAVEAEAGKRADDVRREISERLDKLERDVWSEIGKLRDWQTAHERNSSDARLEIEREMGRIRELIIGRDGRMDEVIRRLSAIEKKLDEGR